MICREWHSLASCPTDLYISKKGDGQTGILSDSRKSTHAKYEVCPLCYTVYMCCPEKNKIIIQVALWKQTLHLFLIASKHSVSHDHMIIASITHMIHDLKTQL